MEAAAIAHLSSLAKMRLSKATHPHTPRPCCATLGSFDSCLSFDVLVKAHQLISSRLKKSTFSSNILFNPAETVGTSANGVMAIRHHHLLALQIAASDTAPSFPQDGASVRPSWRPDSCAGPTSTHQTGGPFRSGALNCFLSFRGLDFLGLTLPGDGCHRSALPLPVIPAWAPPFD